MDSVFLDAEWRKLLMINYSVEAVLLKPYLPYKTELDYWNNRCYVSLVGFMFLNTKVKGFSIPFHENFEELNLRFYVRYKADHEWRRGVVFVKEIVPRRAISWVANTLYKEHYETLPMSHRWNRNEDELTVEYHWKKGHWNSIKATTSSASLAIQAGSEEEFITEHYWGYSKKDEKSTVEYPVEHPRWEVYPVRNFSVEVDFNSLYGGEFGFLTATEPQSVFLAEGSGIKVGDKRII